MLNSSSSLNGCSSSDSWNHVPNSEDGRKAAPLQNKVFNDNVHGHMMFHPLIVKIIDTPQFQRLRNIKQVSTVYFVYPGGNHNRFEHSLGVCYLAGEMIDALKRNCPRAAKIISERDKLCVQIAGLCHDLGHGPFSHLWENFLMKCDILWKHEDCSMEVFDYLLKENPLVKEEFEKCDLTEIHVDLIKELIRGRGSIFPKEKHFLYQIISNEENGIDVDKWDYFLRDGQHLHMNIIFDYKRLLQFCRVNFGDETHIIFQKKEALNIYNMFQMRALLHFHAYQHRVTKSIEVMLIDALMEADNAGYGVTVPGNTIKLTKAHHNMDAFLRLTDHVFYDILYSCNEDLKEAQTILNRILTRDLYQLVGYYRKQPETSQSGTVVFTENQKIAAQEDMERKIEDILTKDASGLGTLFKLNDFVIKTISIDFGGKKENDPFKNILFYSKENPEEAVKMDSSTVPIFFSPEQNIFFRLDILVFCRKQMKKQERDSLKELFELE